MDQVSGAPVHAPRSAAGRPGQGHGFLGLLAAFRIGVAVVGLVFSVSWMLERATLTAVDPFEGVQTWLVGHPLLIAGTVAALAVAARLRSGVHWAPAGK
ncbi:hypothetical protein [Streptomyces europaeiscabiei]|uniref:hypothetical protein n=1 Tax=Streptomyces europaeiscabiei TaxID=146819 RepID=UPI002E0F569E|nr:hypothetical protein OHB30_23415 [Streptomyces europaeiscabiei]